MILDRRLTWYQHPDKLKGMARVDPGDTLVLKHGAQTSCIGNTPIGFKKF